MIPSGNRDRARLGYGEGDEVTVDRFWSRGKRTRIPQRIFDIPFEFSSPHHRIFAFLSCTC